MQAGIKFSPIKVDGDLICDGHHRYVAALLANFPIEKIAWQSSSATTAISWSEVYYDENDWDTAFEVKMRNIQDATYNDLTLDQIEDLLKQFIFAIMLIFLDIDGVMVPAKNWKQPEMLEDGFPAFSQAAVAAFNIFMSADDEVVLISSHRDTYSIEAWKQLFANRGLIINKLTKLPQYNPSGRRLGELLNYMKENAISDDFIILDDDKSLNDLPANLKKHLVQPYAHIGLTAEHAASIQKRFYLV